MPADEVGFISFGLGGHHLEYVPQRGDGYSWGGSCSGYETPDTFWASEGRSDLRHVIPDGTPVVDERSVLREHPEYAFESPMVSVSLDHVERCPEPDPFMAAALGGSFRTLALKRLVDKEWGGLDRVPLTVYLHWWMKRGARIGYTSGRSFVWLDDAKLGIRPKLVQKAMF